MHAVTNQVHLSAPVPLPRAKTWELPRALYAILQAGMVLASVAVTYMVGMVSAGFAGRLDVVGQIGLASLPLLAVVSYTAGDPDLQEHWVLAVCSRMLRVGIGVLVLSALVMPDQVAGALSQVYTLPLADPFGAAFRFVASTLP